MSKNKQPSRPTGTIRNMRISQTNDGMPVILPQAVFSFPSHKEAAEEVAMNGLMSQLKQGFVPYYFTAHRRHEKQDGPDFDVMWNGVVAYVEATELAPLSGPYEGARRVFTVAEMADILDKQIQRKNAKYCKRGYKPVFLLVYITDDAFYVAEEVLLLLAHYLQGGPALTFEAVFFVSFWGDGRAHLRMPYPHAHNLLLRNFSDIRDQQVINPDISKYRLIETDPVTNSVTIRQYLPAGCDLSKLVASVRNQMPGLDNALAKRDAQQGAQADESASGDFAAQPRRRA